VLHVRRVLKYSKENLVEQMSSRCEDELTGRLFVREGGIVRYIRIWATPPRRLVFWDGAPGPYKLGCH